MNSQHVLLMVLIFVNTASAMKHKGENVSYENKNELVSFKTLKGFPVISLDNGNKWVRSLTAKEQQEVYQQLYKKDDLFQVLFRVSILPQDIRRLIVGSIFEDDNETKQTIVDMLCKMPLCDAWKAMPIFRDPKKYGVENNFFTLDQICEYAHDIIVNHEIENRKSNICLKEELTSVARLMTASSEYVPPSGLKCQFYYQPTINNFKKQWTKDQFCLWLTVLGTYVLSNFPDEYDYIPNERNIELNKHINEFNMQATSLYNKTGYKPFLGSHIKNVDNYTCVINNFGYQKLFVMGVMSIPLCYWLIRFCKHFSGDGYITDSDKKSILKIGSMGCFAWLFVVKWRVVPFLLSCISSRFSDGSLVGVGCIGLLYGLLCSGYNIYQMNRLRTGFVRYRDIFPLLEHTDIQII
jgi:hypothetical protein